MQSTVVERHARDFAGSLPLTDPRVSPRYADLTGVAPFIVQAGSAERLVDEAREIVARAREAGVDASLDLVHEMPHNPPALADFHPECRHATERLQRYLREKLA
jgi:acetyl esterase/lipase